MAQKGGVETAVAEIVPALSGAGSDPSAQILNTTKARFVFFMLV
jgi:hypothetical protein